MVSLLFFGRNMYKIALGLVILASVVVCSSIAASSREKPLVVGATVSLEGKYLETSRMIRLGYELWASHVNEKGGLLGREVRLVFYDDKSRPDLVRNYYRKLIEEDGAELILSPYGTPLTLVASEVTEETGRVMIACSSAASKPWERGFRYLFGIYALADRYFISFHDVIARQGFRTVAIIYESNVFNVEIGDGAADWAKRFGLDVVFEKDFTDGDTELPGIFADLQKKLPDAVVFSAYPPDSYKFLELLKQEGYKPKALGMTIVPTYPDFYERIGPFAEGIFSTSQWEPDERIPFPGTARFIEEFKKFAGSEPSYHAGSAYASCQLLEQAVNKVGGIDHAKIREYIQSLDSMTIIGRFKVDETGRQIGHSPILIQWQEGKKEIVHPRKMRTKTPVFAPDSNQ